MGLNKSKGNMYQWCDYTWNPIKGRCPHNCDYCYMQRIWKMRESKGQNTTLRLVDKELKTDLGSGKRIFVGSSTDIFADAIPDIWVEQVLAKCRNYSRNKYIFQTKNPKLNIDLDPVSPQDKFPKETLLGTTIETTYENIIKTRSSAYYPEPRKIWLEKRSMEGFKVFVSIEPVMKMDIDKMISWIRDIKPEFVSIGADSKGSHLREPSKSELKSLIYSLTAYTTVWQKKNLRRLL